MYVFNRILWIALYMSFGTLNSFLFVGDMLCDVMYGVQLEFWALVCEEIRTS